MALAPRAAFIKQVAPLAMQWGVTAYSAAVSLGLSVLFARSMGSSSFGHYTYIYVLVTVLVLMQDAGFNVLLMRERASPSAALSTRYSELPSTALMHLLVTTSVFMLLAGAFHLWVDGPALMAGIFCFAMVTLTQWQSSWFKGAGNFQRDAQFLFYGRTVSALFVLGSVLIAGAAPVSIFLAWGLGLGFTLACHFKHFPAFRRIEWKVPAWAYRSSVSFFAVGLASTLYHHIDIVILRHLLGEVPAIGQYAVATRIQDGLMALATPVALMLFRRMRILAVDGDDGSRFSRNSVVGAAFIGLLLALGGWVLGPWVVGILFGSAYADGAHTIIRLLFTGLIFALPNYVMEQHAIATQQERWFAKSLIAAVTVNVALNFALIPVIGVAGAALATLLTEICLCTALCCRLRRTLFN
ncbi:oligosaccharide flippase family protein [Pseudomonas sp. CFBP 8772]|uniref:oligosaccharide flippase family protein n=1 Tax=Pseudomonas sp. CFBP 8772 TaxID=2775284 RepID=UPI0010F33A59|nr:polysaccharide biosynthesis C-terminal domain-containing protein [Pseudomonas sp. CFBP 8772]MBD8598793.1 polysaccharide biosynthesis C-terminal domain-containing protein [Pseudomonas sp. CFBP 8772]RYF52254.1 MAG: polysaccharide export protein [Cytophagaceae bacterium]